MSRRCVKHRTLFGDGGQVTEPPLELRMSIFAGLDPPANVLPLHAVILPTVSSRSYEHESAASA